MFDEHLIFVFFLNSEFPIRQKEAPHFHIGGEELFDAFITRFLIYRSFHGGHNCQIVGFPRGRNNQQSRDAPVEHGRKVFCCLQTDSHTNTLLGTP